MPRPKMNPNCSFKSTCHSPSIFPCHIQWDWSAMATPLRSVITFCYSIFCIMMFLAKVLLPWYVREAQTKLTAGKKSSAPGAKQQSRHRAGIKTPHLDSLRILQTSSKRTQPSTVYTKPLLVQQAVVFILKICLSIAIYVEGNYI